MWRKRLFHVKCKSIWSAFSFNCVVKSNRQTYICSQHVHLVKGGYRLSNKSKMLLKYAPSLSHRRKNEVHVMHDMTFFAEISITTTHTAANLMTFHKAIFSLTKCNTKFYQIF